MVISYKFCRFSIVQSVAPRKIRAEIICSLACSLGDLGGIHAYEWPLKNPKHVFIYRFQGIFNANVFRELAVYSESKIIISTSGLLQGFQAVLFFQVNRQGGGDD